MIEKFEPKEIFLTENAISKILSLREEESNKSLMLRVFVTGGGCSGFQYGFKFDDQKDDEDTLVDFDGADVVVDPLSMQYVFGSTIDYVQNLEGAKFVVDNPNAESQCGCGASFSIYFLLMSPNKLGFAPVENFKYNKQTNQWSKNKNN